MASLECSKKLLYVFNFIFWAGGAALLGFGGWMLLDPTMVHYLVAVNIRGADPILSYAAWIFIAAGGLALIVGFLGCCGAMRQNQALIFVYIMLLVLIMAGEMVGGILALLYRNKIETNLENSMRDQVWNDYTQGSTEQAAWDFLQQQHKCCGGFNGTDYKYSRWWNETRINVTRSNPMVVPDSCCVPDKLVECQRDAKTLATYTGSDVFYGKGCYDNLETWIKMHSLIMMILGIAISGMQIFAFVAACCVRTSMKKYDSQRA